MPAWVHVDVVGPTVTHVGTPYRDAGGSVLP
jgi:hypothetical protein